MDRDDVDGVTSPRWPEWMAAAGIDDFDDVRRVALPNSRDVVQAVTDGAEVALAEPEMPACEFAADSTPCSTSVWRWRAASCITCCIRGACDDRRIVALRDRRPDQLALAPAPT
ncbi:hypothetical protein [Burkholderia dolosa]|uniref:hypothetical protein n=1 Tax=Burkholderia dolosa TaxID=152500 RepID=UPI0027D2408D|nr:hypothetical protein [Burkholderia dolosa]